MYSYFTRIFTRLSHVASDTFFVFNIDMKSTEINPKYYAGLTKSDAIKQKKLFTDYHRVFSV